MFYKPEELRAGMRLAKQIYNKQGVLLYERGLVLTDQIINCSHRFRSLLKIALPLYIVRSGCVRLSAFLHPSG